VFTWSGGGGEGGGEEGGSEEGGGERGGGEEEEGGERGGGGIIRRRVGAGEVEGIGGRRQGGRWSTRRYYSWFGC